MPVPVCSIYVHLRFAYEWLFEDEGVGLCCANNRSAVWANCSVSCLDCRSLVPQWRLFSLFLEDEELVSQADVYVLFIEDLPWILHRVVFSEEILAAEKSLLKRDLQEQPAGTQHSLHLRTDARL